MTIRTDRVGESLREVIAHAVAELSDPRLSFVTITGVDVTADFSFATAYFTVLGGEDEIVAATAGFKAASRRLQSAVSSGTRLRRTPRVSFAPDHGVIAGERVDAVLRTLDIEHDDAEAADDTQPAVEGD